MKKVNVAGVLFDKYRIKDACIYVSGEIDNRKNNTKRRIITIQAANVDSVVKANINEEMKRIKNKFDIVLADGMPIVWVSKVFKDPIPERASGPDFFMAFNEVANYKKYKYYFLGSTVYTLNLIKERISKQFPEIEVVGMYSPPFSDMKDNCVNDKILKDIEQKKPDIVWVSFGCPKQERWIIDNKDFINASMICGIGAAFEFYAGTIKRAPLWMQRLGLEWYYRFLQEPKRLGRRYFVEGPLFLKYVILNKNHRQTV